MPTVRTCPGCSNPMQPTEAEGFWSCACGVGVTEVEDGGLTVSYPPGYTAEKPTPITGIAPPVAIGDHFDRPSTPIFEVKSIEGEGVNAMAKLRPVSSPSNGIVEIPVDSLRYGDNGWRRC
jgi:hypothetical protein